MEFWQKHFKKSSSQNTANLRLTIMFYLWVSARTCCWSNKVRNVNKTIIERTVNDCMMTTRWWREDLVSRATNDLKVKRKPRLYRRYRDPDLFIKKGWDEDASHLPIIRCGDWQYQLPDWKLYIHNFTLKCTVII